jgi:sugar O-acyltransferase (sialic acid O-acetyltransferase NeuD family)
MEDLIIVGTSTTSQAVLSFIRKYNLYNVVGFAVNRAYLKQEEFLGLHVYAIEDLDSTKFKLFIAIQWNRLNADRRKLYIELKDKGFKFVNLISPNSIINGSLKGDNCWISDGVIIEFGTIIDDNVFIKTNAVISFNVHIYSHCFIGAKSYVAGGSIVGEQTFIGVNATIFDQVKIGKKCLIGACAVVNRSIPDFCKYSSSISLFECKQYTEEEIENKLLFSKNIR